ncbi:class I mannose-6-phosphate isomerase [Staphylococcus simiae]|uniref:type I phosphomannose isomerase catalytic subunit n=1 Tax=Staphylococcus simiae TaxID=308354 RepID=UPI001A95E85A|nr:type I phosphomannose isomerase catalytic subunit [Staphylococcus simiae]MBO1199146.1 class I mannose-6-phosphate isomerase [Staphylococcus simiae]MBO1201347.1 class I mannose-6-phosphate isomerase [Staphylococcus simiae]MBO1203495.1 class I mannose-6-phosphate isomerase [Staphylococcus simiae]MBO1211023.1 class I mannose-6-phosphate isomerase [Staphylococcus simiae]MBO1229697.1 class I mannose-6-phosphate isomerase [Staphylococcus simiae]
MPLFLQPILKEKPWGGQRLGEFGYTLSHDHIGECWCVSAHPNGKSIITNEPYQGQSLDQVWAEHRELFGDFPSKDFPLLTKIVDAQESLSVHVHPDDSYAYEHEHGQYGKSECWYIIDATEGAQIVIGTELQSREQFEAHIEAQTVEEGLRYIDVKPGDFYFIPAGSVHTLTAGILAYETMQSSDITYRVYDYNRQAQYQVDRPLEIEKALDVIEYNAPLPNIVPETEIIENHKCTHIVSNDFFTLVKWEVSGTLNYMKPREFCLVTVLEGEGQVIVDGAIFKLMMGTSFILTSEDLDSVFEGDFTLMISYI